MDGRIEEWTDGFMTRWVGGWVDQEDGWMDEWWIEILVLLHHFLSLPLWGIII